MWIRAAALVAIAALAGCGGGASRRVVTDASIGSGQPISGSYVGGAVPALGDSAPHIWTSGHPYNNQVHGVDVSRYQGSVDWATARAADGCGGAPESSSLPSSHSMHVTRPCPPDARPRSPRCPG